VAGATHNALALSTPAVFGAHHVTHLHSACIIARRFRAVRCMPECLIAYAQRICSFEAAMLERSACLQAYGLTSIGGKRFCM